uniref:Phospholipid scramblase n=1 Tax=Romanomermis culicivorax TaxID=13658 RepID=A0A915KUB5_ROMCU
MKIVKFISGAKQQDNEKTVVGVITKKWSGLSKELFSDTDTFGINFPQDLDYTIKTVLLCCVFLVDFMFYESSI